MAERDTRARVPRPKVETVPEDDLTRERVTPTDEAEGRDAAEAGPEGQGGGSSSVARARQSVRAWLHETFPGHEHAVTWGFIGFLVAILFFVIGFWRTLLVVLLVFAGVAFGQVLDGDPKIINTLRGLFSGDNGR